MRAIAALAAATLLAAPASAQDAPWTFALSPYVWLPGVSTSLDTAFGAIDVDTSAADAVSGLDMAFMGAVEARTGRWGLIFDALYADVTSSTSTPFGVLADRARAETRLGAYTIYAGYRVYETEQGSVDVLAGGRYFSLDVDLTLTQGIRPRSREISASDDWSDAVVGLRGRYDFNDRFFGTALVDGGGFAGGSDSSWQAFASMGYQFDPRWSVQGGWRYLTVEKEIGGRDVEVDLSGPLLGVTLRF